MTPLLGVAGGVARCVRDLLDALPDAAPEVEVVPYVLSRRAREDASALPAATRFLRVPAGLAIRAWGFVDAPAVDDELGDVDVVHGTNFVVPPTRRPTTVTVHDTWCLRHPRACAPSVRPFDRAVRRAVHRGAWLHVSTSAVAKEVAARYRTSRVAVVPFGVPALAPTCPLPPEVAPPFILAISTDEPRKRHAHLVRAFAEVAARLPDLQLVLAGADGAATHDVVRAIGALPDGVGRRVVRLGAVDESTRSGLVRSAAALAYPSSDEGFGFPVLEAMSVGVPVVATRVGGIPETAGDAALLIDDTDDVAPLADAIHALLRDDDLRAQLVTRGRERVMSFSWDEHARGMAALWRQAVDAA